jgi:hypothetical protein
MMGRRILLVILGVAVIAAMAIVAGLNGRAAAAVLRLPAQTCTARRSLHDGIWRVDDDLFAGMRGPLCITTSDGHDFTVDDSLQAQDGQVVAYPAVRIGDYYGALDPGAPLPARLPAIGQLTLHITSGSAAGSWQADADLWFFAHGSPMTGRGSFEMVIITRQRDTGRRGRLVRVDGRDWLEAEWSDHPDGTWPLLAFYLIGQRPAVAIRVADFTRWAVRNAGLPYRDILASAACGAEILQGGRGLHVNMTANGLAR